MIIFVNLLFYEFIDFRLLYLMTISKALVDIFLFVHPTKFVKSAIRKSYPKSRQITHDNFFIHFFSLLKPMNLIKSQNVSIIVFVFSLSLSLIFFTVIYISVK